MTSQFNFSEGSGVTSNGSITNDPYAKQVAFYLSGDNLVDNGVNQIDHNKIPIVEKRAPWQAEEPASPLPV